MYSYLDALTNCSFRNSSVYTPNYVKMCLCDLLYKVYLCIEVNASRVDLQVSVYNNLYIMHIIKVFLFFGFCLMLFQMTSITFAALLNLQSSRGVLAFE